MEAAVHQVACVSAPVPVAPALQHPIKRPEKTDAAQIFSKPLVEPSGFVAVGYWYTQLFLLDLQPAQIVHALGSIPCQPESVCTLLPHSATVYLCPCTCPHQQLQHMPPFPRLHAVAALPLGHPLRLVHPT